jgi:hypothetical protein
VAMGKNRRRRADDLLMARACSGRRCGRRWGRPVMDSGFRRGIC